MHEEVLTASVGMVAWKIVFSRVSWLICSKSYFQEFFVVDLFKNLLFKSFMVYLFKKSLFQEFRGWFLQNRIFKSFVVDLFKNLLFKSFVVDLFKNLLFKSFVVVGSSVVGKLLFLQLIQFHMDIDIIYKKYSSCIMINTCSWFEYIIFN